MSERTEWSLMAEFLYRTYRDADGNNTYGHELHITQDGCALVNGARLYRRVPLVIQDGKNDPR